MTTSFEITDLRAGREQVPARFDGPDSVQPSVPDAQMQRWTLRSLSIIAVLAILAVSLPPTRGALAGLAGVPSPAEQTQVVSSSQEQVVSSSQVVIVSGGVSSSGAQTPDLPSPTGPPVLPAPAPTNCWNGQPPTPTAIHSPTLGPAFGAPPLWVIGPSGPPPTLSLTYAAHPETVVNPFGWRLHDTEYGWPVPIYLVVPAGNHEPLGLTGSDAASGQPLLFGLVVPGGSGLPIQIGAALTLDLQNPIVPAAGASSAGTYYWDAYVFLPGAGCYVLKCRPPGGGWTLTVSAGS